MKTVIDLFEFETNPMSIYHAISHAQLFKYVLAGCSRREAKWLSSCLLPNKVVPDAVVWHHPPEAILRVTLAEVMPHVVFRQTVKLSTTPQPPPDHAIRFTDNLYCVSTSMIPFMMNVEIRRQNTTQQVENCCFRCAKRNVPQSHCETGQECVQQHVRQHTVEPGHSHAVIRAEKCIVRHEIIQPSIMVPLAKVLLMCYWHRPEQPHLTLCSGVVSVLVMCEPVVNVMSSY